MSARYTAKDARAAFARLSSALGKTWSDEHGQLWKGTYYKPEAAGHLWGRNLEHFSRNVAQVGAWHLDHNGTYGGYIVAEMVSEGGGESHPLGERRKSAREFCEAVYFAEQVLRVKTATEMDAIKQP